MLSNLRRIAATSRLSGADPTAGELIYAVGDVHGRYDLLKQLTALILKDCTARAEDRRPLLIFCGDYVDRGPHSAEVLEALIWLQQRKDIQTAFLKGNHEAALLCFLDNPADCWGWLRAGGAETLESYGVAPPLYDEPASCFHARDLLRRRMPSAHRHFLEGLEPLLVVGDYAFVHAGVRPGVGLHEQSEEDLLWIREAFLDDEGPFEKIIVHGHGWTGDQPQLLPHRIGLDTGAYETGVLTAVRLGGETIGVLQAGDGEWTQAGDVRQAVGLTAS